MKLPFHNLKCLLLPCFYVHHTYVCRLAVTVLFSKVSDPIVLELPNDRTETYVKTIRDHMRPSLQMVVIIFPTQRDDRYSSVKKLCCIESPVPSQVHKWVYKCWYLGPLVLLFQVINARTISQQQKLRSVTQKIALQINCKMGGELWALDIPMVGV